jgi:hypothetical protein
MLDTGKLHRIRRSCQTLFWLAPDRPSQHAVEMRLSRRAKFFGFPFAHPASAQRASNRACTTGKRTNAQASERTTHRRARTKGNATKANRTGRKHGAHTHTHDARAQSKPLHNRKQARERTVNAPRNRPESAGQSQRNRAETPAQTSRKDPAGEVSHPIDLKTQTPGHPSGTGVYTSRSMPPGSPPAPSRP